MSNDGVLSSEITGGVEKIVRASKKRTLINSLKPMSIVELQHVRKAYDTKIAVADLSFTIEPRSMFGLLAPNSSGKPSNIRMIIGITVPDSGTVNLFGRPIQPQLLIHVS